MIFVNVIASEDDNAKRADQAIRTLKKKMQRELIFSLMKSGRYYVPPSVKKVEKRQESERRRRKSLLKRMED